MAQIWINSEDRYLSARMVISKQKSTVGYLLVPGLFEPSCDLFYFFQEFIEEIKVNGSIISQNNYTKNSESLISEKKYGNGQTISNQSIVRWQMH